MLDQVPEMHNSTKGTSLSPKSLMGFCSSEFWIDTGKFAVLLSLPLVKFS